MEQPDDQMICKCGACGVPVLTWWAPNGGGLLRGEYFLAGDVIFHLTCADDYFKDWPADPGNDLNDAFASGIEIER
jgi:hypothetical protein